MACIETIRYLRFRKDWSIRKIARELGVSRQTVRKAITSPEVPRYNLSNPRPKPVLGPFIQYIDELLEENQTLPRKQRYTARKIFELIRDNHGYPGCESIVRDYVRQKKIEVKEVFLPLEFAPAQYAQCDWFEVFVILRGQRVKVQCFAMRLCASRASFLMVFPTQSQEAFFEGHRRAFLWFGGVPHNITYDNLATAVKKVLKGKNRVEQDKFISFRTCFGFKAHFCDVGKPNQKGQVENFSQFAEENFFSPLPEAQSLEELNSYLLSMCEKYLDRPHPESKDMTIGQVLELERESLNLLPEHEVEVCRVVVVKVTNKSTFRFEGNSYSVPSRYAGRDVTVKAFVDKLKVLHKDKEIAIWPRCYEKGHRFVDFDHYLEVLVRKPGAVPFVSGFKDLSPLYKELYGAVTKEPSGNRLFIQILLLSREYPRPALDRAIEKALRCGNVSYEYIKHSLERSALPIGRESHESNANGRIPGKLLEFKVRPVDLTHFNSLIREGR